jgi:hypothetical protein
MHLISYIEFRQTRTNVTGAILKPSISLPSPSTLGVSDPNSTPKLQNNLIRKSTYLASVHHHADHLIVNTYTT